MKKLLFVWDNLGPIHIDRIDAVAEEFKGKKEVIGIELHSKSSTYDWDSGDGNLFDKVTINDLNDKKKSYSVVYFLKLVKVLFSYRSASYFFCHYERPSIFFSALILRLMGRNVYVMNDSKYDDYHRFLPKEILKSILYFPYVGAIGSGFRSVDYLRFLGFTRTKVFGTYNCMSIKRIRDLAKLSTINSISFKDRHFTIIARLVSKKNLFLTLEAYSIYIGKVESPRELIIAGSGPLESELKEYVKLLCIDHLVVFKGFIQTADISKLLVSSLCLILLSTEEQFGNVIIEALALDVPCIVSTQVGARDRLIRTGVNGFIVEEDNAKGAAFFMAQISENENLWLDLKSNCAEFALKADVINFVEAVKHIHEKIN